MKVDALGAGCVRVEHDGRTELVYVAGSPGRRWAFWKGQVFREESAATPVAGRTSGHGGLQHITAPMPATVLKVMAVPGQAVQKGDTLIIVEAMKMELPLRASAAATVVAVPCREGDLVQPEALLVELA